MSDTDPNGTASSTPSGYPGAPTPPPYGASDGQNPYYPQQPYGYGAAPAYIPTAPPAKTNALAITSLVSSIAAFVIVPLIGSIVGVITGHISLKQLRTSGEAGRGMALAGTIVGWVGIGLSVITIVLIVLWFIFVFGAIASSGSYYDYS